MNHNSHINLETRMPFEDKLPNLRFTGSFIEGKISKSLFHKMEPWFYIALAAASTAYLVFHLSQMPDQSPEQYKVPQKKEAPTRSNISYLA